MHYIPQASQKAYMQIECVQTAFKQFYTMAALPCNDNGQRGPAIVLNTPLLPFQCFIV